MRLLLDTHAFLWFVLGEDRLSERARTLLVDSDNALLLSPASYWEIAIKIRLGHYTLPGDFSDFMNQQVAQYDLIILPITIAHAAIISSLPMHHRDPFDRLLVAQAMVEQLPLVSADEVFDRNPISRW